MAEEEGELRTIVARAARHDPDAWEALYRRAYPTLFAYARRRLGSDADADDAVSEAMVRAMDRIGSFRWQGAGVHAWLVGILRNVVLEGHRRAGRTLPTDDVPPASVPGPLDRLVDDVDHAQVRAAFGRLDPAERELLELRVVVGLSAEATGTVLGRREGAVRMGQSRALRRLRTFYAEVSDAV